jgi:hypothetical protein
MIEMNMLGVPPVKSSHDGEGQHVAGVTVKERGGVVPFVSLRGCCAIRADAEYFG